MDTNDLAVLRNGDEIFPAMLRAIDDASESIDFVTFVYWTGDIAERFARALADAARRGVRVRVVLDGVGSAPMSRDLVELMQDAGARVAWFRPPVRWRLWEQDHRTHRKIMVCDASLAFTGGVGIAEEWTGDARNPREWRDTHVCVRGPAVAGLRAAFMSDWRDIGFPMERADLESSRVSDAGAIPIAVIDASARIEFNDAQLVLEALIAVAEQRILIETPYFNPTESIIDLLIGARRRGVGIDVVVPGPHIDKRVSRAVAAERYRRLIDEGVGVWKYQPTMLHVKALLVDGEAALLGSVNVNRRSVEKDEEVAMVVLDRDIVRTLERHAHHDLERSVRITQDEAVREAPKRLIGTLLRPLRREF